MFVNLDCTIARRRGFYGHVKSDALERVRLSVVDAGAHHVVRGRRQLAKASEDDFLLSAQLDGPAIVRQDGRDAVLAPGAMALYASTRPYELVFSGRFRQLVMQLPRTALTVTIANPDELTASALRPTVPETHMLGTALGELTDRASLLSPSSHAHVAASLVQALAAALSTLPRAARARGYDARIATRERVRAFVDAHLDEPDLSPSSIASALGYSRQHVHRLFAGDGESLERYISSSRLERVRADLANPALASVSIGALSARRGFASPEHFSRAFHARYATTATAFRREADVNKVR